MLHTDGNLLWYERAMRICLSLVQSRGHTCHDFVLCIHSTTTRERHGVTEHLLILPCDLGIINTEVTIRVLAAMIIGFTQLMMYDIGKKKGLSNFADAPWRRGPQYRAPMGGYHSSSFKLQGRPVPVI